MTVRRLIIFCTTVLLIVVLACFTTVNHFSCVRSNTLRIDAETRAALLVTLGRAQELRDPKSGALLRAEISSVRPPALLDCSALFPGN